MIAPLEELIDRLRALPGIGRKSAERITFYLLSAPPEEVSRLAEAIGTLRTLVRRCRECFNFSTGGALRDLRWMPKRDPATICVVGPSLGDPQDRADRGIPRMLPRPGRADLAHGRRGSGDLTIDALLARVKREGVREVILALEPKLEGEITGMHLLSLLKPLGVRVSQIAQGIPVGRDLEFADEVTLGRALRGRVELD